jgi:hypothetical protein
MLPRNLTEHRPAASLTWDDLNSSLPTIVALAQLCGNRLASGDKAVSDLTSLPLESLAILYASRQTGSISVRADRNSVDPGERYLAVCVELIEGHRLEFRFANNPERTIRFVDAFRELCRAGLVMHQLNNEFSLTAPGFGLAKNIDEAEVSELLDLGRRS